MQLFRVNHNLHSIENLQKINKTEKDDRKFIAGTYCPLSAQAPKWKVPHVTQRCISCKYKQCEGSVIENRY